MTRRPIWIFWWKFSQVTCYSNRGPSMRKLFADCFLLLSPEPPAPLPSLVRFHKLLAYVCNLAGTRHLLTSMSKWSIFWKLNQLGLLWYPILVSEKFDSGVSDYYESSNERSPSPTTAAGTGLGIDLGIIRFGWWSIRYGCGCSWRANLEQRSIDASNLSLNDLRVVISIHQRKRIGPTGIVAK